MEKISVGIPEGIAVSATGNKVSVKGKLGSVEREFQVKGLGISVSGKEVCIELKGKARERGALLGTVAAHIKKMFRGVSEGYSKKLQAVHSHFPLSIEVKGSEVMIKNFLGEKVFRKAKIVGSAKVEAKGQEVTVSGTNAEDVGQTAANICAATRIRKKDGRVFQDGIYPVE